MAGSQSVRNTGEGVESMGRGRAKAKQTKVARKLKYDSGPETDLERLQAELSGRPPSTDSQADADSEGEDDDPYAKYIEDDYEDDSQR